MSYLNQNHSCLFVHVFKNAGISISAALRDTFPNELSYSPPRIRGIPGIDLRLDFKMIRNKGYFAVNTRLGLDRLRSLEEMTNGHLSVATFEENIAISKMNSLLLFETHGPGRFHNITMFAKIRVIFCMAYPSSVAPLNRIFAGDAQRRFGANTTILSHTGEELVSSIFCALSP